MQKNRNIHIDRVQLSDGTELADVIGMIADGFLIVENESDADALWINLRIVDKLHGVMPRAEWEEAGKPMEMEDSVAW